MIYSIRLFSFLLLTAAFDAETHNKAIKNIAFCDLWWCDDETRNSDSEVRWKFQKGYKLRGMSRKHIETCKFSTSFIKVRCRLTSIPFIEITHMLLNLLTNFLKFPQLWWRVDKWGVMGEISPGRVLAVREGGRREGGCKIYDFSAWSDWQDRLEFRSDQPPAWCVAAQPQFIGTSFGQWSLLVDAKKIGESSNIARLSEL